MKPHENHFAASVVRRLTSPTISLFWARCSVAMRSDEIQTVLFFDAFVGVAWGTRREEKKATHTGIHKYRESRNHEVLSKTPECRYTRRTPTTTRPNEWRVIHESGERDDGPSGTDDEYATDATDATDDARRIAVRSSRDFSPWVPGGGFHGTEWRSGAGDGILSCLSVAHGSNKIVTVSLVRRTK